MAIKLFVSFRFKEPSMKRLSKGFLNTKNGLTELMSSQAQ